MIHVISVLYSERVYFKGTMMDIFLAGQGRGDTTLQSLANGCV